MEEKNHDPNEITSIDVNKVLQSSIIYLNKKRKFQADQSGLPLPKHKCWERGYSSKGDSSFNDNPRVEEFNVHIIKSKTVAGAADDESEIESAKDSNSFSEDTDSVNLFPTEAKVQAEYLRTYPSDRPSTSSVNWGSGSFKSSLYSLDSRSLAKSSTDRVRSQHIGGDPNLPHNDFGLHTCLNFDEQLLEFGSHEDYGCLEDENEIVELYSNGPHENENKELEDRLYSNGPPANSYILSSGRWSVNQETQPSTKSLTIDKEFEQYFSMLML